MSMMNRLGALLGLAAVLALGACTSPPPPAYPDDPYRGGAEPRAAYSGYGVVDSIDVVKQGGGGSDFGLGTIAGAVVGGIAGHQVGSGRGNTAATIAGTAGGAYIGHQLEKRNQAQEAYAITIRMDSGSYQTLTQPTPGGLRVGDRVRIENGSIQRY